MFKTFNILNHPENLYPLRHDVTLKLSQAHTVTTSAHDDYKPPRLIDLTWTSVHHLLCNGPP